MNNLRDGDGQGACLTAVVPGEQAPRQAPVPVPSAAGELPVFFDLEEAPPADEEFWAVYADPDTAPPLAWEDEIVDTPAGGLPGRPGAGGAPGSDAAGGVVPAGLWPRDLGDGAGFAAGGVGDRLPPGPALAGFAADAWEDGLAQASDDELIGILCAWRRLNSWTTAGELAAVTELNRRRSAQVAAGADPHLIEHLADEIAAPLTLTTRAAQALADFADELARLPLTRAALAGGVIDRAKALVITGELGALTGPQAAAVEARLLSRAREQTTGQLRAAARRAVLAADPAAAAAHRERAAKDARVEVWDEPSGTASLAGRDLPAADVLAADKRIDGLARELKAAGAEGTLDQLRATVYTALLLGRPVSPAPGQPLAASPGGTSLAPPPPAGSPAQAAPAAPPAVPEALAAPAAPLPIRPASVNLTMPLATWLGVAEEAGQVAGYGPVPARDARALASLAAGQPGTRWCITLTDVTGRAAAHGCARWAAARSSGWVLTVTLRPLATGACTHDRASPGYQPSPSLRHIVNIRQQTCAFPGCRRPAARCDQDHTIPHDQGGLTCECNLEPLCRRHHRAKQAAGWHLDQPQPGTLVWTLPHGRSYTVTPEPYPG